MGFFGKPEVPQITDEPAVVGWFLRYDDELGDVRRRFGPAIPGLEAEIIENLRQNADAASLEAFLRKVQVFYQQVLPRVADLVQRGGPYTEDQAKMFYLEAVLITKIRILGYVLKTKHRIDPLTLT